ncbi:MAG TPA: anhydro-N-acetylmuramic acid kinase [Rubrivivax sp.]|nr:anhydro-N-acetylmuramic acid kinase [Burkholderiales bacterium]HNU12519.1 anhydro-N-acetylmuramic acid kinase [Rubrivivax sp.]
MTLCVGLMSGTSLDGVDGVLAEFDPQTLQPRRVRAHDHAPLPASLREELLSLNEAGTDELHRAALAANALMRVYAQVVARLLAAAGIAAEHVLAIGAHGQTVRHRPHDFDGIGYSVQLANGALLAEQSGITTVCDFRSADVAAGGQGAPLVPAFHAACFSRARSDGAVLNIGGIANLTLLPAAAAVGGLDTGPGNMLLDLWCQRHWDRAYDADGAIAATGQVLPGLLEQLGGDPYFALPPPKSTGRDHFHAAWLDAGLRRAHCEDASPADVMTTLAELSASTAADALRRQLPSARWLRVCGGGAFNVHLMARLRALLPGIDVDSTAADGVPPDQVEALAFAWLAARRIMQRTGSLPEVTGARAPRILGAVHAAPPPER